MSFNRPSKSYSHLIMIINLFVALMFQHPGFTQEEQQLDEAFQALHEYPGGAKARKVLMSAGPEAIVAKANQFLDATTGTIHSQIRFVVADALHQRGSSSVSEAVAEFMVNSLADPLTSLTAVQALRAVPPTMRHKVAKAVFEIAVTDSLSAVLRKQAFFTLSSYPEFVVGVADALTTKIQDATLVPVVREASIYALASTQNAPLLQRIRASADEETSDLLCRVLPPLAAKAVGANHEWRQELVTVATHALRSANSNLRVEQIIAAGFLLEADSREIEKGRPSAGARSLLLPSIRKLASEPRQAELTSKAAILLEQYDLPTQ